MLVSQSSSILLIDSGTGQQLSDVLLSSSLLSCIEIMLMLMMFTLLHMNTVDASVVIELARDIDQLIGELSFVYNPLLEFGYTLETRTYNVLLTIFV